MGQSFFKLRKPVKYQDKDHDRIATDGSPFLGCDSAYMKARDFLIKNKGYNCLYNGAGKTFQLAEETVRNMRSEAQAYVLRALHRSENQPIDIYGAVDDLDNALAVHKMIMHSSDRNSLILQSQIESIGLEIALCRSLSRAALRDSNFSWAQALLEGSSEYVDAYSECKKHYHFIVGDYISLLPSLFGGKDDNEHLRSEFLSEKNRLKEKKEQYIRSNRSINDIMPDFSPHPQSINALLRRYEAADDFRMAAELNERRQDLFLSLCMDAENKILGHIGERLIFDVLPNSRFDIAVGDKSLRIDAAPCPREDPYETVTINVYAGSGASGSLTSPGSDARVSYKLSDEGMLERVMGLVHSEPYVMMFGRTMMFGAKNRYLDVTKSGGNRHHGR